ncbi:MAG TPA: hypothetical protein PKD51_10895 [Saprospiraceae bacterium]|nr:hypothetical protein [Saprospiraceae bacterium]HMU02627.1 hypothetical protein [Saprospiraceae bacterium]
MNLIIEGLTGSGKSQIISHLEPALVDHKIFYEMETFGNFMLEVESPNYFFDHNNRLNQCLKQINSNKEGKYILERFHFSYYPFLRDWAMYTEIDKTLHKLNFMVIFLTYHESLLEERALHHYGILNSIGTETVIEHFGSKENALNAYRDSNRKRKECLNYTKLQCIEIDTTEMNWMQYAEVIINLVNKNQTILNV